MRYISVFSGVEAATLAWEPLGWDPVCFCEVDEFPSAVLRHRWPRVPNLGDITGVKWKEVLREWGPVDLVVGGSPCQSFSIAGKREGLQGASGLMWEYVRCVREVMPRWVLWENVPGALSSSHGEDFRCLLESLDALGYGLAWRVLDAQFFGVAQRRERVFLVGSPGDGGAERACEVLFEPESLRWDTPTSREKREELAARAGSGTASAGFKYHQGAGAGGLGYEPEQSPTLTATMHKDPPVVVRALGFAQNTRDEVRLQGGDGMVSGALSANPGMKQTTYVVRGGVVRRLTPRECVRLQGMPDDHTKVPYRGKTAEECPDTPRYKAIGNSMAVPVMRWIGERIAMVDASTSH